MAVEMQADLTMSVGSRLVYKGEVFNVEDEEEARLYEAKGLARKAKKKESSRTQDVQAEGSEPKSSGSRASKTRKTKNE